MEACAKALVKRHAHREDNWKTKADLAADLVTALEALGLFKPAV